MVINVTRRYIFIHISKTAGNSVASQLKAYYPRRMFWLPKENFGMHDTATQIRDKIGDKRYDGFFKFAFVRNPWDRLYSLYTFLCQKTMHPERGENWDQLALKQKGFQNWLLKDSWWPPYEDPELGQPHQTRDQSTWLTDSAGNYIVDYVGKLEQLDLDFKNICDRIGVAYVELPKVNSSSRGDYRKAYTSKMIAFVEKHHFRDIDNYDYRF